MLRVLLMSGRVFHTVRLEYGGMRFENDIRTPSLATAVVIGRMAERHGIRLTSRDGLRGLVVLTRQRARFTVISH